MGSKTQGQVRTTLERMDIIVFEKHLKDSLYRIIPFESYSILFPKRGDAASPMLSEEDGRLLLPVPGEHDEVLGMFVARGVDTAKAKALLPLWEGVAKVVSENLLNFKKSISDPVTGLYTRHHLLSVLERDLDMMRDSSRRNSHEMDRVADGSEHNASSTKSESGQDGEFSLHGCSSVLVVRLASLRDVVREFGYTFADSLVVALADALLLHCPEQAIAARTGDQELALVLRSTTRKAAAKLATALAEALSKVYIEHPLRKERVSVHASVGYAVFPVDMSGADFLKSASEQAHLLLRKARLASALAGEEAGDWNGARRVMGFGQILAEGGRIVDTLPLSRVMVSLGSAMHAREGQRFSVWALQKTSGTRQDQSFTAPLYKGEISLMEVHENTSFAEVIHLGDPSWNLEAGDRLVLLPDEQGGVQRSSGGVVRYDPATGFLRYGDFLAQWATMRDKADSFVLSLARIVPFSSDAAEAQRLAQSSSSAGGPEDSLARHPDQLMAEVAGLCRESFGSDVLAGRYGLNSLIFYHPDLAENACAEEYSKLAELLEQRLDLQLSAGIAPHPFLDFRKSDALENCRKALEYGLLLPSPHIGILDSLALNISADKRYSHGDVFAAIKEYQRALWADEKNALAWNSLGICYAGLGRSREAEDYFSSALKADPQNSMAYYNLGYISLSRGEKKQAAQYFNDCLKHEPDHVYALIRLGQLAESSGDSEGAWNFFNEAAKKPQGKDSTYRHFARLALLQGNEEEAREHLHSALLHDPHDALSLQMLAQIYLDAGEDPDMSLSLARQSISLKPELKSGWLTLSQAFEVMGKKDEARDARIKAGQI